MRPPEGTGVWRKAARRALRGVARGRRSTHEPETHEHRRTSTWHRRHPEAPRVGPDGQCPCLRQPATPDAKRRSSTASDPLANGDTAAPGGAS